jgi:hypothetical protein
VEAIGFDPEATGGQLPTGAEQRGVRDHDGDGNPGATVELRMRGFGEGKLFIVQRSHLVLRGRQTEPGRFEGAVDVRVQEQRTLGARPGFLHREMVIRPEPERSGWKLVRVPPATNCVDLARLGSTLFR